MCIRDSYEIDIPISGQLRMLQPMLHKAGDPPGVGGDDHDPWTVGMNCRIVMVPDSFEKVDRFIAYSVSDAFCGVRAVAGAGKK